MPDHIVGQGFRNHGKLGRILRGILFCQPVSDDFEIGDHLLQSDAWLQAAQRPEVSPLIRSIAAVQGDRNPDVIIAQQEARRHDAHQSAGLAIQYEGGTHKAGVAVELLLPQPVAHGKHRRGARFAVVGHEVPAEQRFHAQHFECVGGHRCARELLRAFLVLVQDVKVRHPQHVFKDVVLVADVEKLRNGVVSAVVVGRLAEIMDIRHREPISVPVGKRFDQDILNDAENDGGRADTECECEDRHQSKAAVLPDAACRIAKVLPEPVESLHTAPPISGRDNPAALRYEPAGVAVPQNSCENCHGLKLKTPRGWRRFLSCGSDGAGAVTKVLAGVTVATRQSVLAPGGRWDRRVTGTERCFAMLNCGICATLLGEPPVTIAVR